jgi:hypothetical protein
MAISLSDKPGHMAKSVVESDLNEKFDVFRDIFFIFRTLLFHPKQYI